MSARWHVSSVTKEHGRLIWLRASCLENYANIFKLLSRTLQHAPKFKTQTASRRTTFLKTHKILWNTTAFQQSDEENITESTALRWFLSYCSVMCTHPKKAQFWWTFKDPILCEIHFSDVSNNNLCLYPVIWMLHISESVRDNSPPQPKPQL